MSRVPSFSFLFSKDKDMKKYFIGIDISKEKINLCLLSETQRVELEIANTISVIRSRISSLIKSVSSEKSTWLLCAEHTGQYIYPLCCACEELGVDLWIESPAQIKHCSGVKRGKDDVVDARRIAEYAFRYADKAKLYVIPQKSLVSIKQLVSERDLYISDKAKYQGQLTDQGRFMDKSDFKDKSKRLKRFIKEFETAIHQIDEKIKQLIQDDEELSRQYRLLCSVDGVGDKVAVKMIVETNGFKDFDNARAFSCHAGVAPFEYCSGSSIRSKRRVSKRADKSIKSLLHMAAMAVATRGKGELHDYYIRKVQEGKNKMSVINAVRAKLIFRMFAVIRDKQPYQKDFVFCLQKS
jgi:transposase